jgi:polysaccharide biosynthesis protein PslG
MSRTTPLTRRVFSHRGRLLFAAALGMAGLGAGALAPAADAAAAPVITSSLFGAHHAGLGQAGARGWPQAPVGAIRLWDNGVAWKQLEKTPGVFDFTKLDALVEQARTHHVTVLLVLGQTPAFYSSNPTAAGYYGPGASAMPAKDAWQTYVKTVAARNVTVWGHAVEFQVWNEADAVPYWTGTAAQMALLTQWTSETLRATDPRAKLVAPAFVARLTQQRAWIKAFYGQRPGGKNVSAYVDALSFQLYPQQAGSPEDSMVILRQVRAILAKYKVSKPIYNTEVNYGMVGGPNAGAPAKQIPVQAQVANVARTYLLNAENHVSRVYWYSWDLVKMSNTAMVGANQTSLTPAGRAYGVVRSWIVGTRPAGCSVKKGTYVCAFKTTSGVRRAVWNPSKTVTMAMPRTTTSYSTADGKAHRTKAGKKIKIGSVPVLVHSLH